MRFINFLLGFIFLTCPKGHCWIGLHLQYRGCSHLAWQTLQKGEREGSVMTVWLLGRVRRPSCWDAVLLCVSQTSPGFLHSYWLWPSSLEGLSSNAFCQVFQFWWNRVLLVHYNKKLLFQIKKKKSHVWHLSFPLPPCGRTVWLARASSQPDSLRKLGCFQGRAQKWKLPGLPLKNKKQKTFYSTCNFETISDLQKHCRNSTNESVYLSPRFPTPYIITVLVLWSARILDWEVSEHCFQHSSYWSKQPQVCVSGMDSGGGELDFTPWWASGKATCQMAFGLGDLWKHCHKSPWC